MYKHYSGHKFLGSINFRLLNCVFQAIQMAVFENDFERDFEQMLQNVKSIRPLKSLC